MTEVALYNAKYPVRTDNMPKFLQAIRQCHAEKTTAQRAVVFGKHRLVGDNSVQDSGHFSAGDGVSGLDVVG